MSRFVPLKAKASARQKEKVTSKTSQNSFLYENSLIIFGLPKEKSLYAMELGMQPKLKRFKVSNFVR